MPKQSAQNDEDDADSCKSLPLVLFRTWAAYIKTLYNIILCFIASASFEARSSRFSPYTIQPGHIPYILLSYFSLNVCTFCEFPIEFPYYMFSGCRLCSFTSLPGVPNQTILARHYLAVVFLLNPPSCSSWAVDFNYCWFYFRHYLFNFYLNTTVWMAF